MESYKPKVEGEIFRLELDTYDLVVTPEGLGAVPKVCYIPLDLEPIRQNIEDDYSGNSELVVRTILLKELIPDLLMGATLFQRKDIVGSAIMIKEKKDSKEIGYAEIANSTDHGTQPSQAKLLNLSSDLESVILENLDDRFMVSAVAPRSGLTGYKPFAGYIDAELDELRGFIEHNYSGDKQLKFKQKRSVMPQIELSLWTYAGSAMRIHEKSGLLPSKPRVKVTMLPLNAHTTEVRGLAQVRFDEASEELQTAVLDWFKFRDVEFKVVEDHQSLRRLNLIEKSGGMISYEVFRR